MTSPTGINGTVVRLHPSRGVSARAAIGRLASCGESSRGGCIAKKCCGTMGREELSRLSELSAPGRMRSRWMMVSGGQRPIREVGRSVRTVQRDRARGLLVLKNGPLCLAVYGGRDLAGLPSADSHRGCRPAEGRGTLLVESVRLSPLANTPWFPTFLLFSFHPLLRRHVPWVAHTFQRRGIATLTSDPLQWPDIS